MVATPEQHAWAERVLGLSVSAFRDTAAVIEPQLDEIPNVDELGLDTTDVWKAARTAFQAASEEVDAQISKLQRELRDSDDPELVEISELGLNAMTDGTRVRLQAAFQEAGDGAILRLQAAAPKLRSAIEAFRKQLISDRRIAACDANPFHVEMAIRATYEDALDQILGVLDMV